MPKSVEKAFRDIVGVAIGVKDNKHDIDDRADKFIA